VRRAAEPLVYTPEVYRRRTLAAPAAIQGRGLFTGQHASLFILPADGGTGVTLRRADKPGSSAPASIDSLAKQPPGMPARNTTLATGAGVTFLTVEHILSALTGLGITDALIELDGGEAPIGDGSAVFLVDALLRAGVATIDAEVEAIRLGREIVVLAGGARVVARPREAPGCSYLYELDYGAGSAIGAQQASWESIETGGSEALTASARAYIAEVAPARTFCLQSEAEQMRAMGLFKGFSPRDLLVIGPDGPIDNEYRFENEPARHKLLDLIGDLALAGGGRPIQADIVATRAGHALNHEMARAIAAEAKR